MFVTFYKKLKYNYYHLISHLNMTTLIDTVDNVNTTTPTTQKWEDDSLKMRDSRTWLTQQACKRLDELCNLNVKKVHLETSELPDEIEFHWYNVKYDLMKYCGYIKDGKYDKEASQMDFSFDTIFNGGFTNPSGKVDRSRLRKAGIVNPFVLDVKRAMADKCVKVWDVSDNKISKRNVWKITIFVHEIRKLKDQAEQPEE